MEDSLKLFDVESKKLNDQINCITANSEPSTQEIIEIYYQIMTLTSMITVLKQQLHETDDKVQFVKITQTEDIISEKFNLVIHPQLVAKLANSIKDTTTRLQSLSFDKLSTSDIQRDAKLYEDLREKMSTMEFIKQYQRSIS